MLQEKSHLKNPTKSYRRSPVYAEVLLLQEKSYHAKKKEKILNRKRPP